MKKYFIMSNEHKIMIDLKLIKKYLHITFTKKNIKYSNFSQFYFNKKKNLTETQ